MTPSPRPATVADLEAIVALDRRCSPVFAQASRYNGLRHEGCVLVVGDEILCGFAAWMALPEAAELVNLAVAPAARGQGLGRALLQASLARWRAGGVRRLLLEVRGRNHIAQSLYRSLGFVEDGRRRGYYPARAEQPADDAVLMSRALRVCA